VVFAAWELIENRFFRDATYATLHYLYLTRSIASCLLLAFWAAWFVFRQRRQSEEDLRRSRERYRGLLEAFPGAVVLYDAGLHVMEWNASAERMYGYPRADICGRPLPIVPDCAAPSLPTSTSRRWPTSWRFCTRRVPAIPQLPERSEVTGVRRRSPCTLKPASRM
jgi:PAS domain-containing protein